MTNRTFYKIALVVIGCSFLISCEVLEDIKQRRAAARQAFETVGQSNVGGNIEAIISDRGAPHDKVRLGSGWRVYEWREVIFERKKGGEEYEEPVRTEKTGTITNPDGTTSTYTETETTYVKKRRPIKIEQDICIERFTVDDKGIVRKWAYEGFECY